MSEPKIPASKVCAKCGKTKPLVEFVAAAHGKFGRRSDCKACHSQYVAAAERRRYKKDRKYRRSRQERALEHYYDNLDEERRKRLARMRKVRASAKRQRAVVGPKSKLPGGEATT